MRKPAATAIAAAVASLSPEPRPRTAPARAGVDTRVVEEASLILGPGAAAWAVEWGARALESTVAQEPEHSDLPVRAIQRSCEALLLEILARLAGHDFRTDLTDCFQEIAASAAERDVPFDWVVRRMREAQQLWLEQLLDGLRPALPIEALAAVPLTVAKVMDGAITLVIGDYLAERERLAEGRAAWQRDIVNTLLDRQPVDTVRAERDLGLTLAHHHTAVVLWRPGGASGLRLTRVAAQFADRLPGATLLTVAADRDRLWAWLSRDRRPRDREQEALASVRPALPGTRAAIGPSAPGTDGFRRTHLQALDTARVAVSMPTPGDVTDWHTVSLPTVVSADLERVRWYVQETLGPLAQDNPAAAEHRATLLSYLETGLSLVRAAEEQHVHRNTIVYRMRRIEELLPTPITGGCLQIHTALSLAAQYGARVLHHLPG
ncbi:helix-turn-helix domain-containing protein [Streptomyces sp. NBC_00631]|uniref:PucR family transcriptional regulator n=1 Tax=Streptomyces sp. NBC_00631 TaxID=2975793 RepID=UPI0030DFF691